ncbi:hypothetical protein BRC62_02970 [Halobacteriales archaeon QH_10_67_13]|nr:MAG: hypothetical protein BRC62_02970 [Halobacteriales archaeon QH_10_67_13]
MSETLPAAHADAVRTLTRHLDGLAEPWALTGSTSFALQGVPVEPDDVDVQTTEAGARAAETLLGEAVTEPVERVESERIRSSLGAARVGGVTVELIGGVEKRRAEGSWTEPPPIGELRRTVALGDCIVPVLPLAYEARAYERLGRKERAALLREHAEYTSDT